MTSSSLFSRTIPEPRWGYAVVPIKRKRKWKPEQPKWSPKENDRA